MANQKTFLQVNGVAVIEQQVAVKQFNGLNGGTEPRPVKTVLELLLEDGSTVYGCNYDMPNARDCEYTRDSVHSVVAHQKIHSAKVKARRTYVNRSNGARKAAVTKRANKAATATEVTVTPYRPTSTDNFVLSLAGVANELRDVAAHLERLARGVPETEQLITPEELDRLREIEKNYDAVLNLFKQK